VAFSADDHGQATGARSTRDPSPAKKVTVLLDVVGTLLDKGATSLGVAYALAEPWRAMRDSEVAAGG
jgi:hypothetical protein